MNGEFEILTERKPEGHLRRFLVTFYHSASLLVGWSFSFVQRKKEKGEGWRLEVILLRIFIILSWPFVNRKLIKEPFPIQFRRRLEMLGPTYIKLGQILSLREDILPKDITDELKNLLDRLPVVPFERYKELIETDLDRSINTMFRWIDPVPIGSASLAQSHRAQLLTREEVVIKVLKPGVRVTVQRDLRLMRLFGRFAQLFAGRFQPKRLIDEFSRYTLLEVDLRNEADNADTFAANFADEPDIVFPTIYREFSHRDVLCMEFFDGLKPDPVGLQQLTERQKRRVFDLGIGAIIRMIFRDGFFHADLHPGNIIILEDTRVSFIDLGMIGRFDSEIQTRMFYYIYSLVRGDAANAARYLVAISEANRGSDPDGFRRAVEDLNLRWLRTPNFTDFSLGQLMLISVGLAGRYRISYPGEVILMVKAIATVEGVGNLLLPGIDVVAASSKHVRSLFLSEFNPKDILWDSLLIIPELLDTMRRSPLVINEGLRLVEKRIKTKQAGPLAEIRGTILAATCILSGSIVVAFEGPIWLWITLFVSGIFIISADQVTRRS